jgi:hypothetical protein
MALDLASSLWAISPHGRCTLTMEVCVRMRDHMVRQEVRERGGALL